MKLDDARAHGISEPIIGKLRSRGILTFTQAQTAALKAGLCNGISLLVCAPTSAGKTTIAEIAAVEGALQGCKTVYLVSHRALAEEKYRLFEREYAEKESKWFNVAIATGDRVEGTWDDGILISTYEKYLALLCGSANFSMQGKVIVADEIQILGEENRGPEIELLFALLRRGAPKQFVGLSATVSNPEDLAVWLNCSSVQAKVRDVPLRHEIWYEGRCSYADSGDTELFSNDDPADLPSDTLSAVTHLLALGRGPILVFTMTKPKAMQLAEQFAERRQRETKGLQYAEQLELFSEPSALVRTLANISEKGVAFHTADLNYSERAVVEVGLTQRLFDVVFATPTLAAGVNFPFQTVVFDSFNRTFLPEKPWLPLSDFRNMAGRAGRLGLHDQGYAVLIARSQVEYYKAAELLTSSVEPLRSVFLKCSLRKVLLTMVAGRVVNRVDELHNFFKETLWWHQTLEDNPEKLERLPGLIDEALAYLETTALVVRESGRVFVTRLGVATAASGLLPSTVISLISLFRQHADSIGNGSNNWVATVIHAVCASDEFGRNGQRNLPFARRNQPESRAWTWLKGLPLIVDPNALENTDKVTNATYGMALWIEGTEERQLRNILPPISYGQMQQLGGETAWILEGILRVARVPDAGIPAKAANSLSELVERLRYGVPITALDVLKAARKFDVPGFGRHRAMTLDAERLSDPNELLKADRSRLLKLLQSAERVERLVTAVTGYFDLPLQESKSRHIKRAQGLELSPDIVKQAYELTGEQYEVPVEALLRVVGEWKVTKLDAGKRQGYPDFLIVFGGTSVLFECKTKAKDTATISKDDAFAVLTKGTDFAKDHSVTLGKPDFDEFSKGKANGSTEITLLRHQDFVEGVLRYKAGKVGAGELFAWLTTPGYAQIETLDMLTLRADEP